MLEVFRDDKIMTREEVDEYWERKGKYLYEDRLNSRANPTIRDSSRVTDKEREKELDKEFYGTNVITFPKYCYFGIVFCALILGIAIGYLLW